MQTQQINFTGNLDQDGNIVMFFLLIIEEAKGTILDFLKGTMRVLRFF